MIDGILVGQYERIGDGWLTGTTVVLCPAGAVGGVDSRGGAPGTRETDLLDPRNLVDRVHAVMLTGGSAYGLAAATGVMEWLEQHGIGWPMGTRGEVVPIVPGAVLYDLGRGGDFGNRPTAEFGWAACAAATADPVRLGNAGAGAGAKAGGFKGGLGFSSVRTRSGVTVEVVAAINAIGSIVDRRTGRLYSDVAGSLGSPTQAELADFPVPSRTPLNTTIAVVSTDAALTKAQCQRLAGSAQDGLAIAVRPAHLMSDGDTVFALSTGAIPIADSEHFDEVLSAAASAFVEAVYHGILAAQSSHSLRSYRDACPSVFR
jgi:L-aminopeptidase/D-esterase-like protein